MEKETIATLIKRGNGEKETVVCCIFTHACVFFAISTASYSTFTFLVSHSANAINSHVRFATIGTFCQTNTCSFTENVKFILLPYHQVIIDLNLSALCNSKDI